MYLVLLLVFTVSISWLNYRLLARLFPAWGARPARYAFLLLTAAAVLVLVFGWPRRPSLMFPGGEVNLFLIYVSLTWLSGQLFLAALQPLLYAADRLAGARRAAKAGDDGWAAPGMTRREARLTRRTFLQRALAVVPLAAFGAGGQAVYEAQTALEVVRHTLVIPGLPAKLDGFRIGQISDTHLGPYFSLARLDYALGLMAAEKPDLVVMTGDFADDLSLLKEGAAALAALGAAVPHGVYFCWGNHEYFRDVAFIRTTLERAGIKQLKNAGALIVPGGRPFYLLGVDFPPMDNGRRGFEISPAKRREYFAATTATVPSDAFRVLIAHHPDFLYDGFAAGIPLTLAGHTHGGQVAVGGRPLIAFADYARGLYEENGVVGYVSSGAGHWFPFRFGCPPEISVFTLKA